ncbi:hypothetical protein CO173_04020 [Candidatus Uhrbacteria bacterium CG_4_9_14_3_um_filter_41_35]|uniref:Type IV secretion system coupling protein TraD DNA-binding domain-containing protein n=1 Tax=Candidatus Uhrbacteria bacterium CG_4_9_14_3_um_filter_41_35 TaxID=1975034 RepID=A0A2M7XE72_9BACT|nr:MAG: hypothetical protein COV92_00970 [Candidatus Uhrbacteria bacterium CG11_big_fil_rev_8_21_14_0_20_41_9]PJA46016.1 MAG: hypothetical protein CO173_04020 [Candidatus Uhrbacteria bacterium CG_4_9_14_3_um_filter_41_35]
MRYEHDHENDTIYFGSVNFRNLNRKFGIKTDDRRRHTYVIGKTGMGKTTLLENMILSDIYAGHGCAYIDPHGDTAEKLLEYIPSWRINDVVYFNPSDMDYPVGFNILESVDDNMKHLVAAGLMGVFKKIWEGVWSARMEYIMNNTILALLDTPGTTLLGINRMLSDKDYRNTIIANVQDPIVKQFWIQEFGNYQDKFASEAVAPIQNKVGQFLSASIIRNIVAQSKSTVNFREVMDDQRIFIVNLSKGRIGEDASRLLGGMLITKIQMTAMERVDMPEADRQDFYMYVDEFQNFAVESFASILSEARKYRLNLIMAHQYIAQLTEEVRDAVFGNVGTMIAFRVGSPDAVFMESEFMPRFTPEDLINLPKYGIYLKLMIDGVTSMPFSASTLAPIAQNTGSKDKVIEQSRQRFSGNRAEIEANVARWSGFGDDVNIEEKMKEVSQAKKQAKKEKYAHDYDCTRCKNQFKLPVELDRNRPIYCEDCKPIIEAERNNKKNSSGGNTKKSGGDQRKKKSDNNGDLRKNKSEKENQQLVVLKPSDGAIVQKNIGTETVSLTVLNAPAEEKKDNFFDRTPEVVEIQTPEKPTGEISDAPRVVPSRKDLATRIVAMGEDAPKIGDVVQAKKHISVPDVKKLQAESGASSASTTGEKKRKRRKRNRSVGGDLRKNRNTGADETTGSSQGQASKPATSTTDSFPVMSAKNKDNKIQPDEIINFED